MSNTANTDGRRIGRNRQPPCRRCGPAPTDTMIQQKNQSCTTNSRLENVGFLFADPASYPGTSQSPARSPTSFNFLFESPTSGTFLWPPKVLSVLPPSNNQVNVVTSYGQMEPGTGTSQFVGTVVIDTLPTLVNPTQIFISLPSSIQTTQQVLPSLSNVNIVCSPNPSVGYHPETNLFSVSNLSYFQVSNVNLLVGATKACTIQFDVIITNA